MDDLSAELLTWAKGPGLQIALWGMIAGLALRFIEIFRLPGVRFTAPPKGRPIRQGLRTIFSRSQSAPGLSGRATTMIACGWGFHIAFVLVLLFEAAHIRLFRDAFGLSWSSWPVAWTTGLGFLSVACLLVLLADRVLHPVKRLLSRGGDYVAWVLTALPLITGLGADLSPFADERAWRLAHILSVEALMLALPFTKLVHVATIGLSRFYNGRIQGHKGAPS